MKKKLEPWEVLVSLFALAAVGVMLFQRHIIYRDGKWGLLEGDNVILVVWHVLAIAGVLIFKPWKEPKRPGNTVRLVTAGLAIGTFGLLLLFNTSWGRYQVSRFEVVNYNLKISSLDDESTRQDTWEEFKYPEIGRHMVRDTAMLQALTEKKTQFMRRDAAYSRRILSALLAKDIKPTNEAFLLTCLMAEADPKPWWGFEWVPRPSNLHESQEGLQAGLLSDEEARQIVQSAYSKLQDADRQTIENLVFCMLSFPGLFESSQREELLQKWARQFQEVEPLAVESLVVRREIEEFLTAQDSLKVRYELTGFNPEKTYRDVKYYSVPEAFNGLLRSCGKRVKIVEKDEELLIKLRLREVAHHQYQAPTFDYETYYDTERTSFSTKYGSRYRTVQKSRQVVSGYESKTSYAPVLEIELLKGEDTLNFPETLVYWRHLNFDHENKRFLEDDDQSIYGRMWPLGIDEELYRYPYLYKR